jgi:hypothetical protein
MVNNPTTFRIWDNSRKDWLYNSFSLHCFSNWQISPFTGELSDFVGTIDGDHTQNFFSQDVAQDYYFEGTKIVNGRYLFQRNTGIKASCDTEIFEGDIIQFKYWVGDFAWEHMTEAEVEYQRSVNGREYIGIVEPELLIPCNLNIRLGSDQLKQFFSLHYAANSIILGNKFENPELKEKYENPQFK